MRKGTLLHMHTTKVQMSHKVKQRAPKQASNKPAHPQSLISLRCPYEETSAIETVPSEYSDQTARMRRLI